MSMLKKAAQRAAYAKIGIYGEAGSGKTYTAAQFAIGLHQYAKLDKPIGMFDTEPAAGYIIPLFEEAGIDFLVYDESRALQDLMAFMDEAEEACSVVIVDSITHVWRDTQESYLKKINQRRRDNRQRPIYQLEFHHWRPIKAAWAEFTDRFLASKLHMIVCGRAGSIYSYQDKDDGTGKKELIQEGTRMATEKEMGYEPSLLVEMVKKHEDGRIVNVALVEKDRSDKLNGHEIPYPKFADIIPHVQALNLGGEHFDSMEARDSQDMFTGDEAGSTWDGEKQRRTVLCEEIIGEFVRYGMDGQGKDAKVKRLEVLEEVFGTRSWEAISNMHSDKLKTGLDLIRVKLGGPVEEVEMTLPAESEVEKAIADKEAEKKAEQDALDKEDVFVD